MSANKGVLVHILLKGETGKAGHPKATAIRVDSGHLLVQGATSSDITAIYAPGTWTSAVVAD